MIKNLKSTLVGGFAALLLGVSISASAGLTGSWVGTGPVLSVTDAGAGAVNLQVGSPEMPAPQLADPDMPSVPFPAVPPAGLHYYLSTAASSGTYSFSWAATVVGLELDGFFGTFGGNNPGSLFDYILLNNGPLGSVGFGSIDVDANDVFGFTLSTNSLAGYMTLSISEFDFTPSNNVPEPGSLALLGLGLIGLAAIRRRKSA